jgi:hypothetical protein
MEIICLEEQCNFLAAHRTMFGNNVPIKESEDKSSIKHLWLPNATIMWEDEGVDAFYSCCCENTIYWNATCTESGRNRPTGVPLTHFCEVEIVFGQPPCYSSSVDIFIEVAKEDYVVVDFVPLYELGDQLLKKNGSRRTCITKGGEVSCVLVLGGGSCRSTRVAGLIGYYDSCLFGSRSDSYPAPSAEAGVVGS